MTESIPYTLIALAVGILLGFAAAWGFVPFLLVVVFGGIGLLVGRYLDGALDVDDVFARRRTRRP